MCAIHWRIDHVCIENIHMPYIYWGDWAIQRQSPNACHRTTSNIYCCTMYIDAPPNLWQPSQHPKTYFDQNLIWRIKFKL